MFEVRVADDSDREVPVGVVGEIQVRPRLPDIILREYWRRPEATIEATRNLWFHTGARGRMYADGGPPLCVTVPTTSCHPAVKYEPLRGSVVIMAASAPFATTTVQPDANGHFSVAVTPGQYEVTGHPTNQGNVDWLKQSVTVASGQTATVDLGIHMP